MHAYTFGRLEEFKGRILIILPPKLLNQGQINHAIHSLFYVNRCTVVVRIYQMLFSMDFLTLFITKY